MYAAFSISLAESITPLYGFNVHGSVHRNNILTYIQQDASYTVYFI